MLPNTTCQLSLRSLDRAGLVLALLVAAGALWLAGCGGGGGGGGTPPTQPPMPPPQPSLSYTPDNGATSISLSLSPTVSGQELTLTVTATDVSNLNGLAFDLVYPTAQVNFVSASELPAFSGGNDSTFQVFQQPGRLVVGLARLGATTGFSGTGGLLSLTFASSTPGTGRIDFENQRGTRSNGTVIGSLDWIGGSVTVN